MIDEVIVKSVKEKYGFDIVESKLADSYFERVWEIQTDTNRRLILKILPEFYKDIISYQAVIAICEVINREILDLKTIVHTPDKKGATIQEWKQGSFYVLIAWHDMVGLSNFNDKDQMNLGHLMSEFHKKLKDFNHPGLGTTWWMRSIDDKGLQILEQAFPDKGFLDYMQYTQPIDYAGLGLALTTIHGDWHRGNMSFTDPPFLFDYDTLSRGAAVEDIARTLTQWTMEDSKRKSFYDNFIQGYQDLTAQEKELIPKFMIASLYSSYAYFMKIKDNKNAQLTKNTIPIIKQAFNLRVSER